MSSIPLKNRLKMHRAIKDWMQEELSKAFGVPVEDLFQLDDGDMPNEN